MFITKLGCGTIADSSQHTATTRPAPAVPGLPPGHLSLLLTPVSPVSPVEARCRPASASPVVLQVLAGGSELTTTSVTSVLVVPVWDQCQAVCCVCTSAGHTVVSWHWAGQHVTAVTLQHHHNQELRTVIVRTSSCSSATLLNLSSPAPPTSW